MSTNHITERLSSVGSLETFVYRADAVYAGLLRYSLQLVGILFAL